MVADEEKGYRMVDNQGSELVTEWRNLSVYCSPDPGERTLMLL